jgi:hypothetical protein
METAIEIILAFVNSPGTPLPVELNTIHSQVGKLRLRLVAVKILAWLKLQRKLGKPLPLDLDDRHEWCRDLVYFVNSWPLLQSIIRIEGAAAILSSDLSVDAREKLLTLVDTRYQPRLIT